MSYRTEIGDVIEITVMESFITSMPIYARRIESDTLHTMQLLVGRYTSNSARPGKVPGDTFILGAIPSHPESLDWRIVPQPWPEEVCVAIAALALTGKVLCGDHS
jgi:hypothetical protein